MLWANSLNGQAGRHVHEMVAETMLGMFKNEWVLSQSVAPSEIY